MQKSQWTNNFLVINPLGLQRLLETRRGSKALAKLLPLLIGGKTIDLTYEELRELLRYKTRAGAYQAVKKLVSIGTLEQTPEGLRLKLGELWLNNF